VGAEGRISNFLKGDWAEERSAIMRKGENLLAYSNLLLDKKRGKERGKENRETRFLTLRSFQGGGGGEKSPNTYPIFIPIL